MLTLIIMQRGPYDTVTLPVLIPCELEEKDGTAAFLPGLAGVLPVRILGDSDLHADAPFWKSIPDQNEFLAVVRLVGAVNANDQLAAADAAAQLAGGTNDMVRKLAREFARSVPSFPREQLERVISKQVKSARLVVWTANGRTTPAIFCPDNQTALFVTALLTRISGRGLAICPHCGKPFLRTRSDQEYCTIRHREAHRVARWRKAQKRVKGSTNSRKQKHKRVAKHLKRRTANGTRETR